MRINLLLNSFALLLFFSLNANTQETPARGEKDPLPLDEQHPVYQTLLDEAQAAIDEYPEGADAYFTLGFIHQSFSNYNKAIEFYNQGLQYDPQNASMHQAIAFLYKKLHEYENAVEWYNKALALKPDLPNANENLGLCLVQLNQTEKAIEAFKNEVKHYPEDVSAHFYLAQQYFEADQLDPAETHARQSAALDNRVSEPYYLLGNIYRKRGEMDQMKTALETFREKKDIEYEIVDAIDDEDPTTNQHIESVRAETHNMLGQTYYLKQNLTKAEQHFKQVMEINPDRIEPYIHLFNLYQDRGQFDKAEEQLRELVKRDPQSTQIYILYASFLLQRDRPSEAISIAEQGLEAAPGSLALKRLLAEQYLRSQQNRQRALDYMLDVVQTNPTATDMDVLSWAYFANGYYKECLAAIQRAMKMDPDNPTYKQRYEKLRSRLRQ